MSSSSPKVSLSSITKSSSDTAERNSAPTTAGRHSLTLMVASLLVTISVLSAAVFLITTHTGKQKSAWTTPVDDDDEAAIQGSTGAQTVVHNQPLADQDSENNLHVKPTRGAIAGITVESSSDVGVIDDVSARTDAPKVPSVAEANRSSSPEQKDAIDDEDDRCSEEVQFTMCSGNNRDEFFFDAERHECRSKFLERPPACLAGQNRFKSIHECKLACLDQAVSEDRCGTMPLFQRCTARDLARQWWYLKDGTCHAWKLPNSNCVSPRLALFGSREDCHSLCVAGHPLARHPACDETPVEHACTAVHMVYPVLAVTLHNRVVCVQTDPSELKCLTGANRFRTKESCRKACLQT